MSAGMAARDRRVVLFIGDGSFQVTCLYLSKMIRNRLKPVIFLINNDGYTIERVITDHLYDNIQPWLYHKLVDIFGGGLGLDVRTEDELEDALEKAPAEDGLVFIEIHTDRPDRPEALRSAGRSMAKTNQLDRRCALFIATVDEGETMATQTQFSNTAIMNIRLIIVALLTALLVSMPILVEGCKSAGAAGESKSPKTKVLKTSAGVIQVNAPLKGMDIYLVGFHPMKLMPSHQMEAHHFCRQVNKDFMQCVLFDGNTKDANLNGIEYIISEKLYDALPVEEKEYWHPHNYEILSGQLVAPGMPKAAEHALIGNKMNSYGKTWHVWMTGTIDGPGDKMPFGEAMLSWSFNHDGEAKSGLVEHRDMEMGIDSNKLKSERKDLLSDAHPQGGVDAIKNKYPGARPVSGVTDSGATHGP